MNIEDLPIDTQAALRQYLIEVMESVCSGDSPAHVFRHCITTDNMAQYRFFLDQE